MKRTFLLALGAAALAAVLPASALATIDTAEQGVPPPIPMTAYGSATGASVGQGVIAIVTSGSVQTVCGDGVVVTDAGSPVYVIDVIADGQKTGCGAPGRTVQFYFTPATPGSNGAAATTSVSWAASFQNHNLTAGAPLTNKGYAPGAARDGTW